MGHKTWAVGEEVIASDFNPQVADQIVAQFANAAARTAGWAAPPVGAVSHLTDTPGVLWVYYGGTWHAPGSLGLMSYQVDGTDINVPAVSSVDLPGMLFSFTPPANRRIKVTLSVQFGLTTNTPGAVLSAAITTAANAVLADRAAQILGSNVQNTSAALTVIYLVTSTGAALTFKGRAANTTAGATALYAQDQAMIVEDIGGV